uniref:NAD-dependent epimerase/dehydratase domain-containing protein n=1 Tax=viral metagenome TaxID=1070528 RepID=A0A6C0KI61_9ZZZZ
MNTIKILLFGKGWIGSQLESIFHSKAGVTIRLATSRANHKRDIVNEMDEYKPTHVVSCIGRTHGEIDGREIPTIDYLEYDGKLLDNVRDNLYAPVLLAHLCKERNTHYTYLGTGCIFEYDAEHQDSGFKETDEPNFFGSSYSIVKGFTDQLMSLYQNTLNVRIRMPITAAVNDRDFITKIVRYEKICSMANSMTVLDELLPVMADMIITGRTGTIQLTNPGTISHEEILEMYREIVDPEKTWTTMTYEEQSRLLKSKRSNNYLDTSLLREWYPDVSDIKTAIRRTLETRKSL